MCFEKYYPTAYIEIYNYIMRCRQPATRIVVHSPSPERNRPTENNRRQILSFDEISETAARRYSPSLLSELDTLQMAAETWKAFGASE